MTNDLDRRFLLGGLAGAAGISALAAMAKGGPLNPPAGSVASTAKPLAEIEPRTAVNAANTPGDAATMFRITQPGSYYLTGNIQAAAGKSGISIDSPDVSLDLMGFAILGTPTSPSGVALPNGNGRTILRNGHIRGFASEGVLLRLTQNAPLCHIEDLLLSGQTGGGGAGLRSTSSGGQGSGAVVRRCVAMENVFGISVDRGFLIEDCSVYGNSQSGISCGERCIIRGCTAMVNAAWGIFAGFRCRISGNTCINNGTQGSPGTGGGISADTGCYIEDNYCENSPFGYVLGSGVFYVRNVSRVNVTSWTVGGASRGIVLQAPTGASAFTGTTGGAAMGPTGYDANANFTL